MKVKDIDFVAIRKACNIDCFGLESDRHTVFSVPKFSEEYFRDGVQRELLECDSFVFLELPYSQGYGYRNRGYNQELFETEYFPYRLTVDQVKMFCSELKKQVGKEYVVYEPKSDLHSIKIVKIGVADDNPEETAQKYVVA